MKKLNPFSQRMKCSLTNSRNKCSVTLLHLSVSLSPQTRMVALQQTVGRSSISSFSSLTNLLHQALHPPLQSSLTYGVNLIHAPFYPPYAYTSAPPGFASILPSNYWLRQAPSPHSTPLHNAPSALLTNNYPTTTTNPCYPHTGASYHLTPDLKNIQ